MFKIIWFISLLIKYSLSFVSNVLYCDLLINRKHALRDYRASRRCKTYLYVLIYYLFNYYYYL